MEAYLEFINGLQKSGVVELTGVVGFALTIWGLYKTYVSAIDSKKSADDAKDAANAVRAEFQKFEAIVDISKAINTLESIKVLHRDESWDKVYGPYSEARTLLRGINERAPNISDDDRSMIDAAIQHFAKLESSLDKNRKNPIKFNLSSHNEKLTVNIDRLVKLLHTVKI